VKTKGSQVSKMFSSIADRYDFLNTLLSFGRDRHWRHFTSSTLALQGHEVVLDIATGTGKLARTIARNLSKGGRVVGIDFCQDMLLRARETDRSTRLLMATAEEIPFRDNAFDCVTMAFALRNMADMEAALHEAVRVVKPGGKIVCLEFSRPRHPAVRLVHRLYLATLLPLVGFLVSGNKEAYLYLGRSIMGFCNPGQLKRAMELVGLTAVEFYPLTWGVVTVHVGVVGGNSQNPL